VIKTRDRLKVILCRIGLKPLLPMRRMAYSVKIQLTYMYHVKVYIGAPCPRRCVFICAYFIRRAYYFVMKIHSPRELIPLHLARMTDVFFRHLQYV